MSSFGRVFRVTTFGESHCQGVGCIVDGVPPSMVLTESDIQPQLTRRRPGQSKLTTPRDEKDLATILSGTEGGKTLGTPVALFVKNENVRPQDYSEMRKIPRPGHADYTYQQKYGIRASSGGGRSSARETIGRVAAGAIAEKWLKESFGMEIVAWVSSVGEVKMDDDMSLTNGVETKPHTRNEVDLQGTLRILKNPDVYQKSEDEKKQKEFDLQYEQYFCKSIADGVDEVAYQDVNGVVYTANGNVSHKFAKNDVSIDPWLSDDVVPVRCPEASAAAKMSTLVRQVKNDKDSIGGTVTCVIRNVPVGLGEPCFDKLEALLAHAMLSLPATKGFEIGSGFRGSTLRGSVHNDAFVKKAGSTELGTKTNFAGGILGGISSGQDIVLRVAIKPVSTIGRLQQTCDFDGKPTELEAKGRHDPCVLPRAVPLVEAMAALVLADTMMLQRAREWPVADEEKTFDGPVSKRAKHE